MVNDCFNPNLDFIEFPVHIDQIINRLKIINPERYTSSRNYVDGAVTYLSPYISRGVISTKIAYEHVLSLDLPWWKTEKFVQELAWRDYWQQVWIAKGNQIFADLKHAQDNVSNHHIPTVVLEARTGIYAVDEAIRDLYKTGYIHNHMRMYVASICCNIARSHWLEPAKWMYANLLDGDLASNHLSWQWVAGAFANKKYYANQENINKYFHSRQKGTFLDVSYDSFEDIAIPKRLLDLVSFEQQTQFPESNSFKLEKNKTTLVYNYYNLDPNWHLDAQNVQRIFLIEPTHFQQYPVSQKCIDFALSLSNNISDIKVFVGDFEELNRIISSDNIIFKEHPLNKHYFGKEESRDWLSTVSGYYPSFFSFWRKCKKELKKNHTFS